MFLKMHSRRSQRPSECAIDMSLEKPIVELRERLVRDKKQKLPVFTAPLPGESRMRPGMGGNKLGPHAGRPTRRSGLSWVQQQAQHASLLKAPERFTGVKDEVKGHIKNEAHKKEREQVAHGNRPDSQGGSSRPGSRAASTRPGSIMEEWDVPLEGDEGLEELTGEAAEEVLLGT